MIIFLMKSNIFFLVLVIFFHAQILNAERSSEVKRWESTILPIKKSRHPAFIASNQMRPRVQFWIDIFARYGEHHAVFHHRMRPDIIFYVLDTTKESKKLSPGNYEKHRMSLVNAKSDEIRAAIRRLATGSRPRTQLEQHIEKRMSILGTGTKKYHDFIKNEWLRSQRGIKERYREAIERSGRYMHILEKIFVVDYGLPIELTRIPFIESSFNYKAYSSVGAAGIWQFMPVTARQYKMKVGQIYDERRDVTTATNAAAQYLTYAYRRLGAWPLAVTSYNHGVGGVLQKVKKMGTNDITRLVERIHDQPFGFASQNFFPEIIAAVEIYDNPQRFFPGVRIEPPKELARRTINRPISVVELERRLGISREELEEVNYALHSSVWSGRHNVPAGYTLNVPISHYKNLANLNLGKPLAVDQAQVMQANNNVNSNFAGSTIYRVRAGDSLGKIAQRHGTSVAEIKRLNKLSSNLVKIGQVLKVSSKNSAAIVHNNSQNSTYRSISAVRNESRNVMPDIGSANMYTVQSGDSLYTIALKFGTSIDAIRQANNLSGHSIKVGQIIKISSARAENKQLSKPVERNQSVYIVKSGDSLITIARANGTSVDALKSNNRLNNNLIKPGQKLIIE